MQEHSRISEESHYYPYGLKIGSISAHAYNKLESRYGYQGDFSEEDVESGYDEFALRMYDPQLGKWNGVDPYDQFASSYIGMGNDPVNGVDPNGGWLEGVSGLGRFAIEHFAPAFIGAAIGAATTEGGLKEKLRGAGEGFVAGLAASYIATEVNWSAVGGAFGDAGEWVGELFKNWSIKEKYFLSADGAAIEWARQYSQKSIDEPAEYASLIYEIEKRGTKYYQYTPRRSFRDKDDRKVFSPNPDHLMGLLPKGATRVGHIHSHPDIGVNPLKFSPRSIRGWGDAGNHEHFKDLDFYLTTPDGKLIIQRQRELFENGYWRTDTGLQTLIKSGLGVSSRFAKGKLEVNWDKLWGSHDLSPKFF